MAEFIQSYGIFILIGVLLLFTLVSVSRRRPPQDHSPQTGMSQLRGRKQGCGLEKDRTKG